MKLDVTTEYEKLCHILAEALYCNPYDVRALDLFSKLATQDQVHVINLIRRYRFINRANVSGNIGLIIIACVMVICLLLLI